MSSHDDAHRSYQSLDEPAAREALDAHYDMGEGVYKLWASPLSVLQAIAAGWARSDHPAQLHYGWDLETARSLDAAIRATTDVVFSELALDPAAGGQRVLEPGCGIGGGITQLAAAHPNFEFVGLSIVEAQLRTANARAAGKRLRNARFVAANYLRAPLPDASFAGCYAIEALCYTPVEMRADLMRELFRLLAPGARLAVLDGYTSRSPRDAREAGYLQDVLDGWTLPPSGSAEAFTHRAEQAGFEPVRVEEVTSHILASGRRIRAIGLGALTPLSVLSRVPGMGSLLAPIGFASALGARRFAAACRSQVRLFECGLGSYWLHIFRKPS